MNQVHVSLLGSAKGRERFSKIQRESTKKEPWAENRQDVERAGDKTRTSSDGKRRDRESQSNQ